MNFVKTFIVILLLTGLTFAQKLNKTFEWNGYGQFRLYKINNDVQGFSVRRAKLWVKGNVPNANSFSYKVMGIFKYNKTGYLGLLDAYGEYDFGKSYLRFGQQIPEFSLQRMQPDWKIPVVERVTVIDALIPAAQSSARDIGLQVHVKPVKNIWQIAAGVFNGNGANLKNHNSSNFLYTVRSTVKINFAKNYSWHLGGSVMYRKANQDEFSSVFGKNKLFTGDDFRFGIESLLKFNKIEIQAEYIEAHLGNEKAYGYYAYANYNISDKDQLIINTERLVDLDKATNDDMWLDIGYNHLFANNDVKLMISGGTQFNDNYKLTTQIQLFFN